MKNNIKIFSIVTPSFNSVKYIEDCIQSVLKQNYPDFEHIIIDGGSNDGTIEILKKYPHLIWISEPDEGQSDALNKGFKIARGEIIGWLNADDKYLDGTFYKIKNLLTNSYHDGVYSNLIFIDKNGKYLRKLHSHFPLKFLSLFHCYIPSATFFFKRKIIDNGIVIDNNFHITMDKEFFAHLLFAGYKIKYINDYFAEFRWHEANKSLDTPKIKSIRYKEGLIILNRYLNVNIPVTQMYMKLYKYLQLTLLVLRRILIYLS